MATIRGSSDLYEVEAYQPEDYNPPNSSLPKPVVLLEIYFCIGGPTRRDVLTLPAEDINSWSVILSNKLSRHIPFDSHANIIMKITNQARSTICEHPNTMYCNSSTIPLVVIIVPTDRDEEDLALASLVSMLERDSDPVPASKSSIRALKKVEIQDCSTQCVVCLEDFRLGATATSMPCSHYYHRDCIVKWLKQSNRCPLCRFEMPVEEEEDC